MILFFFQGYDLMHFPSNYKVWVGHNSSHLLLVTELLKQSKITTQIKSWQTLRCSNKRLLRMGPQGFIWRHFVYWVVFYIPPFFSRVFSYKKNKKKTMWAASVCDLFGSVWQRDTQATFVNVGTPSWLSTQSSVSWTQSVTQPSRGPQLYPLMVVRV